MDLFLLHCLILLWASVGSARQLVRPTADRLLAAALLAWANIVATSLLLSLVHRLGDPRWFLATSASLAMLTCGLLWRVRPDSDPADRSVPASRDTLNPWLLAAFFLTIATLALASIGIAYTYQPNSPDALAYHLPRAMYYLGQSSLAHFDAPDLRQVYLPFNYNLLQVFGLVYTPPLQCLNLFNLLAWAASGIAAYRLCRLCDFGPNASLVASGLALTAPPVLVQATAATNPLPAGAAVLCTLVFGLRWQRTRAPQDALLAGLALGLAVGSKLSVLGFVPAAIVLWVVWKRPQSPRAQAAPEVSGVRAWIPPALVAAIIVAPFAIINWAGNGRGPSLGSMLLAQPYSFARAGEAVRTFLTGFGPNPLGVELNETQVKFGFTGMLCLISAVFCLARDRKVTGPTSWFAGLGLGWIACYFLLQPTDFHPSDFVPVLLVMTPCVAALVAAAAVRRSALEYAGALAVLVVGLAAAWTDGDYLLRNPNRPLAPLLNAAFAPPSLPTLPLLVQLRFAGQKHFNIDTDSADESIFPFMALGHGQRFTSRGTIDPDAYNILSRAKQSRNAAFRNLNLPSTYVLISIPTKRTEGVEYLATLGTGAAARDYYGIGPHAGRKSTIDGNRILLVTLYHESPHEGSETRARLKVEGLNAEDQARLVVDLAYENGSTAHMASFTTDGVTPLLFSRPFRQLSFTVLDANTGANLGSATLPYLSEMAARPSPIDPRRPTNARSLFVTDVVLSTTANVVATEGLLDVEGPFPQWEIPYIRWAMQPTVTIKIPPIHQLASLQVSFSVRLHVRERGDLQVVFNGQMIQSYHLEEKLQWLDETLELTPQPGVNVLEFRDATFKTRPDWLDYLERYPDVKDYLVAQKLALEQGAKDHYDMKGKLEGRKVLLRPTSEPEPAYKSYYFMYRNIRLEGFKSS